MRSKSKKSVRYVDVNAPRTNDPGLSKAGRVAALVVVAIVFVALFVAPAVLGVLVESGR